MLVSTIPFTPQAFDAMVLSPCGREKETLECDFGNSTSEVLMKIDNHVPCNFPNKTAPEEQ